MVIINAVVHPVDGPVIPRGFVAWAGERITAVGPMDALPPGDLGQVLDAQGGHVTPGYIDAHCHLGLFPDGQSYDSVVSDADQPVSPDFDPLVHADLTDRCFAEALAAGVTTVAIAPGSQKPMGGLIVCVRTDGWILESHIAWKLALGENPEKATGLGGPELIQLMEEQLSRLAIPRPIHVHAHRKADIAAALALAGRLDLKPVLVHATDGYLMAEELAAAGAAVIAGPCMTDRSRAELKNLAPDLPAKLARAGVEVAICTDHPETPAQYLSVCAALAVRGGMEPEDALAAITLTPARILELDGRRGSLTPGKAADIVLTPGHPLDIRTAPRAVFLGGKQVLG